MRRSGTGYRDGQLSLPAGHLDGGEDAVSGLIRELREELGIEADPGGCRLVLLMHAAPDDGEYLHLSFAVDSWIGEPRIAEPDKCSELRWSHGGALPADVVDYVAAAFVAIGRGDSLALYGWGVDQERWRCSTCLSIRHLDDAVEEKLRLRAVQHGRSMEAEIRAILTEAVAGDAGRADLFSALTERFGRLGGAELDLPPRHTPTG